MPEALDPLPLLRSLHEHGVEHVVVGGFAVNAHGAIRVTKDLDIVPNPSDRNLERLAETLSDLDAHLLDASDFDAEELPADPTKEDLALGGNFCVLTRLGRLDVMQWLSGIESEDLHERLSASAIESDLDGVPIRVCGLEDLRTMKRSAGRPQDLDDLRRLSES
ncbi:MAG: DUF6036 family nucleotidyltransferase [Solirubrobacteraceae bacterium]